MRFMTKGTSLLTALAIAVGVGFPLAAQAEQERKSPLADAPAAGRRVELRDKRFEIGAGAGATMGQDFYHAVMVNEIGRASCRERVEDSGGAVGVKKKKRVEGRRGGDEARLAQRRALGAGLQQQGGVVDDTGERVDDCFFFQAEDGIRDGRVTGVQTCALPIFDAAAEGRRVELRDKRFEIGAGAGATMGQDFYHAVMVN